MEDALVAIAEALDKKTTWVDLVNTKYGTQRIYISYCTRTGVLFVKWDVLDSPSSFARVVCDSSQDNLTKATLEAAETYHQWLQFQKDHEQEVQSLREAVS